MSGANKERNPAPMTELPEHPPAPAAERPRAVSHFPPAMLIAAIVLLIALAAFYR